MPVTRQEFLKLAFILAEEIKIPNRFNERNAVAEKYCYYDPMKWPPLLSLKTPETTSSWLQISAFFFMGS
jgi:hypothetical protein